jgi:hypothetical protein
MSSRTIFAWPWAAMRFHIIPLPIRYICWLLACAIRSILYIPFRQYVLLTCRWEASRRNQPQDIYKRSGGKEARFSILDALYRFHGGRKRVLAHRLDAGKERKHDMPSYLAEYIPVQ